MDLWRRWEKRYLHWHPYLHVAGIALYNVGKHLNALLQFDQCQYVRHIVDESWATVLVGNSKCPNRPPATGVHVPDAS